MFEIALQMHVNKVRAAIRTNPRKCMEFEMNEIEFNSLCWKKSNEFWYKGDLYDLVEARRHDDKYVLLVKKDNVEKKIITDFASSGAKKNDPLRSGLKHVKLDKDKICQEAFQLAFAEQEIRRLQFSQENILKGYFPVLIIPPKQI